MQGDSPGQDLILLTFAASFSVHSAVLGSCEPVEAATKSDSSHEVGRFAYFAAFPDFCQPVRYSIGDEPTVSLSEGKYGSGHAGTFGQRLQRPV
jgi:hypothetical protein